MAARSLVDVTPQRRVRAGARRLGLFERCLITHGVGMVLVMGTDSPTDEELMLGLAAAWGAVERRLNSQLGNVVGLSFAEYRLLRALSLAGPNGASRVALAGEVGLTASAVTRALRPLETRVVVSTVKHERDARLAMATLTPAGRELTADAARVVSEASADIMSRIPSLDRDRTRVAALLGELARA